MVGMPGRSFRGPLPELSDEERALRDHLRSHIERLAGEIGERNMWRRERLSASEAYLADCLDSLGIGVQKQEYRVLGEEVCNLVSEIPGDGDSEETLVLGAHYDSVLGSPGANDNASGVAAVVELARSLRGSSPRRTLRFLLFVNEEPPFFQTRDMGSRVYARRCKEAGERVAGMMSLETIGCYFDEPGTQGYPFPFSFFYPRVGNFLGFVSNRASKSWLHAVIRSFRRHVDFPSEGLAAPSWIPGVGWSDHWSFWQEGYPALMITDTAPYRYPQYHTPRDTPDKVDYERLARVVAGLRTVVEDLATEKKPYG